MHESISVRNLTSLRNFYIGRDVNQLASFPLLVILRTLVKGISHTFCVLFCPFSVPFGLHAPQHSSLSKLLPFIYALFLWVKGYFAVLIFTECCRLPSTFNRSHAFNYRSLYSILVFVSRGRHMQYIFYLNIVNQQLLSLFQELRRIEEYSNYNTRKLSSPLKYEYDRFLCRRLVSAQEWYSLIFDLSTQINGAFGWSHLVNVTLAFVQILTDFYWLYWNIDNESVVIYTDRPLKTISSIVIVILVLGYTTELHAKARLTSYFVHNINGIGCGSRMRILIESFSLQLLKEPLRFHALGCFNLNLNILGDMAAAITTYIIFFIQFTPFYKSPYRN